MGLRFIIPTLGLEDLIKALVYRFDQDDPLTALGYIPIAVRLWLSDVVTALVTDPETAFDITDDLLDHSDLTEPIIRDLLYYLEAGNIPVPNPTCPVSITFTDTFGFVIAEY